MERSLWSRAWPAAASAAASLGLHAAHVVAVLASSGAAAGAHSHAAHPGYPAWVAWAAWGANAIAAGRSAGFCSIIGAGSGAGSARVGCWLRLPVRRWSSSVLF